MTTTELLTAAPATDTPRRRRGAASRSVTLPVRLATVLLAVSTLAPSGQTEGAAELPPPQAATTIDALLPSWRSRVEWALERFAMAGLPLPPIEITVHRHTRLCDGNSGLFRPGPPVEVHVCSIGDADTRAAPDHPARAGPRVGRAYLEPERRSTFLDLRGLEAWVDPDVPAHEWGAEHAAEVVSWGLMDASVELIRINDTDPASLHGSLRAPRRAGAAVGRRVRNGGPDRRGLSANLLTRSGGPVGASRRVRRAP